MARPKKQIPLAKNHQITIRFTEELYDVLTKDAANAKLPRAEYIRQLITNQHPVIHQEIVFDSTELLSIFSNLGKIGGNLNQIAKYLNQGGTTTDNLKKEVQLCIIELYKMRDTLKETVGEYRGSH